ncbi:orotate phosphoribosyltransferase [Candidatus Roizmanbacteria bacterium]|nr:orotate phosphoribosyltransferase [Candidatus Roizmanbacteria bacterium]
MKNPTSEKALEILKKVGAIISNSHIVLTSGRHSDFYVNKDIIYAYPQEASQICLLMAEKFKDRDIETVVGPAMGGVILSQWTAYHLSEMKRKTIHGVFTDKTSDNAQVFKRGYDTFIKGRNVLVVEDLTTTGGSVRKSVDSVKAAGGDVIAVSIIGNRRPDRVTSEVVGAPLFSLVELATRDYEESECIWCKEGRPINTEVGHGKEFLAHKKS